MCLVFKSILIPVITVLLIAEIIVWRMGRLDVFEKPDLILFLGCGENFSGALLKERISKLIKSHRAFPDVPILISGNENKKEVSSVLTALQAQVPEKLIFTHTNAKRTFDSFVYVKNNLPEKKNIFIVTNNFHFRRSTAMAHHLGFKISGFSQDAEYRTHLLVFLREKLANVVFLKDLFSRST